MKKFIIGSLAFSALMAANSASAAVTLLDKDDWKVSMYGFVESDMVQDSTRSFTEIIGNAPVARTGTFAGDNGRLIFSDRNSRLGFAVNAPEQDGWKARGVLEMDFFGYDPGPSTTATSQSEAAFSQNPGIRIRHAYMSAETANGWQVLTGQTWSLFGWQPYYFPTILTVAPEAGQLFQRDLQTTAIKTIGIGETQKLQVAGSLERPSQRDSNRPDMNLGVRYVLDSYRSAFGTSYGDVKTEPLSVGLSSSFRQFETPQNSTTTSAPINHGGAAYAVDALIPLITAADAADPGQSLTLTFEASTGTGYANTLTNWTGGLGGFPSGSGQAAVTNLDAGFGGYDADGNYNLLQINTMNISLQYQLPTVIHSYMNVGTSQISSANVSNQTGYGQSSTAIYDRTKMYFVNYLYDFTKQIRLGAEYSNQQTHYASDDSLLSNNRIQLTGLYRF